MQLLDAIRTNNKDTIALELVRCRLDVSDPVIVQLNSEYDLCYGTPLHYAVAHNCRRHIIDFLWCIGAHVDAMDYYGNTPLHYALQKQQLNLVMIGGLLQLNANVYIKNCMDMSPLDIAKMWDSEVYKLMIPYTKGHRLWVKWRSIIRVLGVLSIQYRKSVENVWKPNGVGYRECKRDFENLLCNR